MQNIKQHSYFCRGGAGWFALVLFKYKEQEGTGTAVIPAPCPLHLAMKPSMEMPHNVNACTVM